MNWLLMTNQLSQSNTRIRCSHRLLLNRKWNNSIPDQNANNNCNDLDWFLYLFSQSLGRLEHSNIGIPAQRKHEGSMVCRRSVETFRLTKKQRTAVQQFIPHLGLRILIPIDFSLMYFLLRKDHEEEFTHNPEICINEICTIRIDWLDGLFKNILSFRGYQMSGSQKYLFFCEKTMPKWF